MLYHSTTPHGNAIHSAEARIGDYHIRRDDFSTWTLYTLSIGRPRHMDWPNRTPLGEFGMIAAASYDKRYRLSAVAPKSRDHVPLPEEYVNTTDIIAHMISLAPLVAAATASGLDPALPNNAWETAKKGF